MNDRYRQAYKPNEEVFEDFLKAQKSLIDRALKLGYSMDQALKLLLIKKLQDIEQEISMIQ